MHKNRNKSEKKPALNLNTGETYSFGAIIAALTFGLFFLKNILTNYIQNQIFHLSKSQYLVFTQSGLWKVLDVIIGFFMCGCIISFIVLSVLNRKLNKRLLVTALVFLIANVLIAFLSLPDFQYIKPDGIYINKSFFSETNYYPWDKVNKVTALVPGNSEIKYVFDLNDGNNFSVQYKASASDSSERIKLILGLIEKNNLNFEIYPLVKASYDKRITESLKGTN